MRTRWYAAFASGLMLAAGLPLLPGCKGPDDPWGGVETLPNGAPKKRVLATIVPIHCFTANVAEPHCQVRCLLPTKSAHGYEITIADTRLVSSADLVIMNGLGMETFVERLIAQSSNRNVPVLDLGKRLRQAKHDLIQVPGFKHGDHYHPEGDDMHVWLGLDEAIKQVELIRDQLKTFDPPHAEAYERQAAAYMAELASLKQEAAPLRAHPAGIVSFHDSFRYFGRSLGIRIVGSISGLEGGELGSAKLLEDAPKFVEERVAIIGVEPQYPRQAAENMASTMRNELRSLEARYDADPGQLSSKQRAAVEFYRERRKQGFVDIVIIDLDPLETAPPVEGISYYVNKGDYVRVMRENIAQLKKAMLR